MEDHTYAAAKDESFSQKKRKREAQRERDQKTNKSRINIGVAFPRWTALKVEKGFQRNAELACFLLDIYEKKAVIPMSAPVNQGFQAPPPPPVSTVFSESLSDRDDDFSVAGIGELDNSIQEARIDWDDDAWYPDKENKSVSSLEEDETTERDTDDDDSGNEDYVPCVCARSSGALTANICMDLLPVVSMEESVHDTVGPSPDTAAKDELPFPEAVQILVEDEVISHPASIMYHNCLRQLAEYIVLPVNMCTAKDPVTKLQCSAQTPFKIHVKSKGTAAVVEWMCPQGHSVWRWSSQPFLQCGTLVGDFMLASNILLSGNNYAKISLLFKFMNMGMVERSKFLRIQDSHCVDSIMAFWNEKRAKIITQLQSKGPVVVLGDALMDSSPGVCAQYCTYTAMDNTSRHIISMVNVDKQVKQRNSVAMEKEGFVRTLESLRQELNVAEVCTCAHTEIAALFTKRPYNDDSILHSLDIWHGSKNLCKKLVAAGQRKGCSTILMWTKDICNHFCYCCKMATSYDEFMDMWMGLLHHVTGEYTWALGTCPHCPLEETTGKDLMEQGSVAHQTLREIILEPRWLKNIHKYLRFRSIAGLESFHNHILMYASKGFSFSPAIYAARTMLAALDYNHHLHRPAKRKDDGSIQYGKLYNKRSRTWRPYILRVEKDYSYVKDLQCAILRRRLAAPKETVRS